MERQAGFSPENFNLHEQVIWTDAVLLEITRRCYVGCNDCYKGDLVSTKGPHVEKETIERRLEWIKKHTDTKKIFLIGGEPLLHPDFPDIVKKAQELGFNVQMISAGQVSNLPHEQRNYQFMLDQVEEGKLQVELSYQPGRNERAFKKAYNDIMERISVRREKVKKNLKYMKRANPKLFSGSIAKAQRELSRHGIFSTVTIPSGFGQNPEKFDEIYKFILDVCGMDIKNVTFGKERHKPSRYLKEKFDEFGKHLGEEGSNERFVDKLVFKEQVAKRRNLMVARIWGPVRFEMDETGKQTSVNVSLGTEKFNNICPAMTSDFLDYSKIVTTDTISIRTDGELTFSTPSCIASPVGFLNVDRVDNGLEIYQRLRANIAAVEMTNKIAMRFKAERDNKGKLGFCKKDSEYPAEEGKKLVCPSCPLDIACNSCFSRTEEQRDAYYQAYKEAQESS